MKSLQKHLYEGIVSNIKDIDAVAAVANNVVSNTKMAEKFLEIVDWRGMNGCTYDPKKNAIVCPSEEPRAALYLDATSYGIAIKQDENLWENYKNNEYDFGWDGDISFDPDCVKQGLKLSQIKLVGKNHNIILRHNGKFNHKWNSSWTLDKFLDTSFDHSNILFLDGINDDQIFTNKNLLKKFSGLAINLSGKSSKEWDPVIKDCAADNLWIISNNSENINVPAGFQREDQIKRWKEIVADNPNTTIYFTRGKLEFAGGCTKVEVKNDKLVTFDMDSRWRPWL